ncbi:MAG: FHA domain-containing protein [Planctomycetes bacterium]|jgi:pSer/pThr/pTyr-binding forkhead associated (FHA) protein|nr:FHA domain-containing protein [Planctomycetota bacterium]
MDVKLVMFKTNGQRKEFPVTNPRTVIGRGEDCDLRIPLVSVSRHHCHIDCSAESFRIKDLGSSNGTYVNNTRITEVSIKAGDRLAVGPVVLTLQVDGKPEQIHPAPAAAKSDHASEEPDIDFESEIPARPKASKAKAKPQPVIEGDMDAIAALESLALDKDDEDAKS